MKRRLAVAALLLFAVCGAVAVLPSRGPHRRGEAAIAIRDSVPGYQQFFTECRQYLQARRREGRAS